MKRELVLPGQSHDEEGAGVSWRAEVTRASAGHHNKLTFYYIPVC
jgi:hypothetical protein